MSLPPPPQCNVELAERVLTAFLREETQKVGFQRAVLGLSGGIDSGLVIELAARAIGPKNVLAIAMPYRTSHPDSLRLAKESAAHAGVALETVDISDVVDAHMATVPGLDEDLSKLGNLRKGNIMSRARMTTLFDRSAREHALVYGTSNKTELMLGYGTIFGDMASGINPIGDLYKSQVYALSRHLGVPQSILDRPPSADLWEGQTDEEEIGHSYDTVDAFLYYSIDRRFNRSDLKQLGFEGELIDRLQQRVRQNQYKRRPPIIAKLAARTVNLDYRYARDWGV
ncbi:MAG: NAD+ synthase [Planctomycetes bacterium]|nr:NAD+ synthase [Planctomycetota bacterium]